MKTVVVDFDGVIAQYDGWKGVGVFGDPMPDVAESLRTFQSWGWRIIIFTVRQNTEALFKYFYDNKIPFHSINSIAHNPPNTGPKPIADVYIDDRDWQSVGKPFLWSEVMSRMCELYASEEDDENLR